MQQGQVDSISGFAFADAQALLEQALAHLGES
jgi:hypothetical protein